MPVDAQYWDAHVEEAVALARGHVAASFLASAHTSFPFTGLGLMFSPAAATVALVIYEHCEWRQTLSACSAKLTQHVQLLLSVPRYATDRGHGRCKLVSCDGRSIDTSANQRGRCRKSRSSSCVGFCTSGCRLIASKNRYFIVFLSAFTAMRASQAAAPYTMF